MLLDELVRIKEDLLKEIESASSQKELNDVRIKALGKSGLITSASKGMRDVSLEDRPKIGALINEMRITIEQALQEKAKSLNMLH